MSSRIWMACLLAASAPANAQMVVGKNVQISRERGEFAHHESIMAADPLNPARLIAASHIYYGTTGQPGELGQDGQSSIVYVSFDAGKTWQISFEPRNHEAAGHDPALAYGPDGSAYFATLGRHTLYRSPDGGRTWEKPAEYPQTMDLDREYLVADFNKSSPHFGNLYMNATVMPQRLVRPLPGRNEPTASGTGLGLYTSRDSGRTYDDPVSRLVYTPQSMGPMGNSVVLSDGAVATLYAVISDIALSRPSKNERMPGPNAALYVSLSEDGGKTLGPGSFISEYWTNKERSQGAIVPWLAVDPGSGAFKDRLYAVWPDFRTGRLEVLLSYSSDRGASWSMPQTISDAPRSASPTLGPDAFLPTVAVNKEGVVLVVWYDSRESPDNVGWRMRARASLDGGETWLPSEKVSEQLSTFSGHERWQLTSDAGGDSTVFVQSMHYNFSASPGHTSGLAAGADGVFHPVWVDNRTGMAQLWTAPITVTGRAVKNGSAELSELNDLGGRLSWELVRQAQVRERGKGRLIMTVRLKNVGSEPFKHGRVKLRVLDMQSLTGTPQVLNADNGQQNSGAVWDFTSTIPAEGLAPGAVAGEKELVFAIADLHAFRKDLPRSANVVLSMHARVLGD